MKRYILDTNVLVRDPSILRKWNATYRLLVPDVVLQEANSLAQRVSDAHNIPHLLDDAATAGFVHILQTKNETSKPRSDSATDRISDVDLKIVQTAKEYAKSHPDVEIVTEDRKLLRYARETGVRAVTLWDFHRAVNELKTVDISDLGHTKDIRTYQLRHLIFSFAGGILVSLASWFGYQNAQLIMEFLPFWGGVILLLLLPPVFYWFRSRWRIGYALLEFFVGFLAGYSTLGPFLDPLQLHRIYELANLLPLLGGIYIMVRGLDNFSKGIQGTVIEPKWNALFNEG